MIAKKKHPMKLSKVVKLQGLLMSEAVQTSIEPLNLVSMHCQCHCHFICFCSICCISLCRCLWYVYAHSHFVPSSKRWAILASPDSEFDVMGNSPTSPAPPTASWHSFRKHQPRRGSCRCQWSFAIPPQKADWNLGKHEKVSHGTVHLKHHL